MTAPIDMVLFCPQCGFQHIDEPEQRDGPVTITEWGNPPHRSHLCHACGHIWRPADVPTNGVLAVTTKGVADSPPIHLVQRKICYQLNSDGSLCGARRDGNERVCPDCNPRLPINSLGVIKV